jgi:hypothetical protein
LNDIAIRIPDGPIIPNLEILHGFDQTTLNVPSLGSLDGSINQTFSTTHGVEPELLRRQTSQIRVLDETS